MTRNEQLSEFISKMNDDKPHSWCTKQPDLDNDPLYQMNNGSIAVMTKMIIALEQDIVLDMIDQVMLLDPNTRAQTIKTLRKETLGMALESIEMCGIGSFAIVDSPIACLIGAIKIKDDEDEEESEDGKDHGEC